MSSIVSLCNCDLCMKHTKKDDVMKGPCGRCANCDTIVETRYCTECGTPMYKQRPYLKDILKRPRVQFLQMGGTCLQ